MARILVVEDEPDLREMIVEELTDEGHVAIEAGNGREGLEKVVAEMPDLVLSDITMPQMNGYQFFRAFKENHPEHADIPFIFLTALSDRDDQLKGLRLGVDDYITKPIDFDLLLARVDLGLRRRPAAATVTSPIPEAPDTPDVSTEDEANKLGAIIKGHDGIILTGKFETISLQAIKDKVGDQWAAMSARILTNARAAIQDHLGPRDVCRVTASEDFVVCFAELTDDEIDAKVRRMADAIWDRLFSATDDEDFSKVESHAQAITLKPDAARDVEATFTEIEELIEQEKMAASQANVRSLKQIFEYEDLFALTLLNAKGTPSKIKMLSFNERQTDRMRKLLEARRYESAFLLELQQLLFERLKEKPNLARAFRDTVMLLPVPFALLDDEETRIRLGDLCDNLKRTIGGELILEITEPPNRIKAHGSTLKPLPSVRKLQFLEIRRTEQLDGIDIDDLQILGIAFISMRYENVLNHDEQDLRQAIKLLETGGTKFFIKSIPEGKLLEAQSRQAHLYALKNR